MATERTLLDFVASAVGLLTAMVLGISAGAMLAEGAVLVPFWRSLPAEAFLSWYAANASLLFDFFAPLEIAGAALAVSAAGLHRYRRRASSRPLVAAAVLAIAVLAAFPLYFRDANASFADGSVGLDRVAEELGRWSAWHRVRSAIGVAAFAAALLGIGERPPRRTAP